MAYDPAVRLPRAVVEELRSKYVEMLAMRVEHASGDEDEDAVRPRMAELAARFPGALREIDDLELDEIRGRVSALNAVLGGEREPEPWMTAVVRFHALTRGALCAKRWLAGRKHVDASVRAAFERAVPQLAFPDDARGWASDLARIASPPRGRVTSVVFSRLARELGTNEREVRRLVFGVPRRERRAHS
jgi:hypothetical protein